MIGLYVNDRVGGSDRWVYCGLRKELMRVPDLVTQGVVFLAVKVNGQEKMAGTAFILGVKSETHPNLTHGYLVTAKHCVEKAREYGNLFVRINRRTGTPFGASPQEIAKQVGDAELFEIEQPKWFLHKDNANDVAVMPFMPPQIEFAYTLTMEESFATENVIANEAIGIGDELMVVGLFTSHYGLARNLPIVRAGIIAAMPREPIQDPYSGVSYDAYLAEVRSVGGLSGSPVWVVINPARVNPESPARENRLHFYLLGLIRGHWKKDDTWLSDFAGSEEESLNTGIAIVTPIQKALDIINSEEVMKERERTDREYSDSPGKLVNTPKTEINEKRKGDS